MDDAASRIVDHYERHAVAWDGDRRAASWIDKPFIEHFLSFLPQGATVLDPGGSSHGCTGISRHRRGQFDYAHIAMPGQDARSGVDRKRYAVSSPGPAIWRDTGLGQLLSSSTRGSGGDVSRLRRARRASHHSDV